MENPQRYAGSDVVAISGPQKLAMIHKLSEEMPLDQIIPLMDGVDIVITEGYKRGDRPKIEVTRLERGAPRRYPAPRCSALAAAGRCSRG